MVASSADRGVESVLQSALVAQSPDVPEAQLIAVMVVFPSSS